MTDAVWFAYSAGGLATAVLITALWALVRPGSRGPRRTLLAIGVLYALASTAGLTHWVARLVAPGYPPLAAKDVSQGRRGIVLLGSGSYLAHDRAGASYSVLDRASAERVIEAVRVYRLVDPAWIISSGGVVKPSEFVEPVGRAMRESLVQLGVPASHVLLEIESRTTHDQATIVAAMLRSLPVDQLILVTSDMHMRRALAAFRAAGMNPIPAVARDPFREPRGRRRWLPTEEGLAEGALAAHEVLGLVYYWLRGWAQF